VSVAYATGEQLADWLGAAAPSDAERLLARASELIDATLIAPFVVDEVTELPSDDDIAAALRDATCAQVEFWGEVGEANDIDGLAGSPVSVGSYTGSRAPVVAPRAVRILANAGLMSSGLGGYL
jgi:hypothetical protein